MLSVILASVFVVFLCLLWRKDDNKKLPPGPFALPIVGYIPFLQKEFTEKQITNLAKQYGPVMSLKMGIHNCVVISDYNILKEFLSKQQTSYRPDIFIFHMFHEGGYPEGILSSSGHTWQVLRRFALRHLKDCGMGKNTLNDVLQEEVDDMFLKIKQSIGKPVNMKTIIDLANVNVISNILTGKRLASLDNNFVEAMDNIIKAEQYFMIISMLSLLPDWLFNIIPRKFYGYKFLINLVHFMRSYGEKHYEEALDTFDDNHKRHFIDYYISEIQNQKNPDEKVLFTKNGFSTLFFELFSASMGTTSVTIRYCIQYLAMYPEIQQKLYEEIVKVLGPDRRPEIRDRHRLPYVEAYINEVQRIADINPLGAFRSTSEDMVLEGYDIPEKTIIIQNLDAIHHDPKIWDKPYEFKPERFLDLDGSLKNEVIGWAPFSLGKRHCPGEALARSELFIFISCLVQEFSLEIPPGVEKFEIRLPEGNNMVLEDNDILIKQRK